MKDLIAVNPIAGGLGKMPRNKKLELSREVGRVLGNDYSVVGVDTTNSGEFRDSIKENVGYAKTLWIMGGDGTIGDGINLLSSLEQEFGFLSVGSGNGLGWYFGFPRKLIDFKWGVLEQAKMLSSGATSRIDLIDYNGWKALFANIGFAGHVLYLRDKGLREGNRGFFTYMEPLMRSLAEFDRFGLELIVDSEEPRKFENVLLATFMKIPYFGYGLSVIPDVRSNDSNIYGLVTNGTVPNVALAAIQAKCHYRGNRQGQFVKGNKIEVKVTSGEGVYLDLNGDVADYGKEFTFRTLPRELKLRIPAIC